jgi:alanine-synthesizing transaminase
VVEVSQASRLRNVTYDIRGPVLRRARQLEAEGHEIIKLNLGNPAPFGLHAPDDVLSHVIQAIPDAQGYSDARGIQTARVAVADSFARRGVAGVGPDDVFLGNGVSELIVMSLQALLNTGDEVLVPSPDYPLWTGAVNLCGGHTVHYDCVEEDNWQPDLDSVASQITERTRALVIINPNNPTGAVYSREILLGLLDLARQHGLLVLTDEIYDQILYEDAVHYSAAELAPDLLVLTLGGLSKTYRNVPAQHAIEAALGGGIDIRPLLEPGGRLRDQRDHAWERMTSIPGISCVRPAGALYLFPKLDPEVYKITDDEQMMMDFLEQQHVLLSHGGGFNLPTTDHLRLVFLAPVPVLDDAIGRLGTFLADYHQ